MFSHFTPRHIPALFVATAMTFGGMWPLLDARAAMLEFGMPPRVAEAPAARPVFVVGNARTTVLGALVFIFYARGRLDAVDTILAVTGAYAGLVDSWVVWREGKSKNALFRLVSSWAVSAIGLVGFTAGR
ncbi:hypothetical protein GGR53DRAFT_23833 [Hypoxylon sp. FL1150]|nr:hypothetical protein GGR53DRAFT_23833 [Hypoxylon sp. FL1150]